MPLDPTNLINIGAIANDGTGDDLRSAFSKINNNFIQLDSSIDASTIAANLGTGEGLYKDKDVNTLQFRSIAGSANISVTTDGDNIVLATDFAGKNLAVGSVTAEGDITAGASGSGKFYGNLVGHVEGMLMGSVYPSNGFIGTGSITGINPNPANQYPTVTLALNASVSGSSGTRVTQTNTNATGWLGLDITGSNQITLTQVSGTFSANVAQDTLTIGTTVTGVYPTTVTNNAPTYSPATVDGISPLDLNKELTTFDFGRLPDAVTGNILITSPMQYFMDQIGMDFGTCTEPNNIQLDFGSV
jgi:hypothetical protein